MAARDIMPFTSAVGSHVRVHYAHIDATADYDEGDVVLINSGDLEEAGDEANVTIPGTTGGGGAGDTGAVGVAAQASLDAAAAFSTGTLAAANAANVLVGYYRFDVDTEFITDNFEADDATAFGDTPDEDDVGTLCSLRTDGTIWGVCNNASSSNRQFIITRVLDAERKDVQQSGATGVWVVFRRNL